ncbi:hypothetical protein MPH_09226 [Macrophomina phaseolina MS6]|uniref:N-acetyltransferase domain-containing protein n=1 Tax=Macrophomina phaseolina (strain MS6) TaxID=1126212 RepID=K2RLD9_MACPH|nr:hypothetical protein MPH_09226 [Macrophomina phaseolina MS6]
MDFHIRRATASDLPDLHRLFHSGFRALSSYEHYTPGQVSGAIGVIFKPDEDGIAEGTAFVATAPSASSKIICCGSWTSRRLVDGQKAKRGDPKADYALLRGVVVDPAYAGRGLGSRMFLHLENEARKAGFARFEFGATITGIRQWRKFGYQVIGGEHHYKLPNGEIFTLVHMRKDESTKTSKM